MSLYRDVTNKPWNTVGLPDGIDAKPVFAVANEKVALVIFVIIACVLFSLLTVSYYLRMLLGGGDWVPVATPQLLWANTAALVLSSVAFQLAVNNSRKEESIRFFSTTGIFSLAGGLLLTGIHMLHLAGGLWVWGRAQLRLLNTPDVAGSRLSLELCAWYWHFLLLVWFGLFYLLATT